MSLTGFQWLLGLSMVLFVAATMAEVLWLVKRASIPFPRAIAFVMVTDYVGLVFGFGVLISLFLVLRMMIVGPTGEEATAAEWQFKAVGWTAIASPPTVIFILKRVFFYVLNTRSMGPWLFSIVVTLLLFLFLLGPYIVYFALGYILGWSMN